MIASCFSRQFRKTDVAACNSPVLHLMAPLLQKPTFPTKLLSEIFQKNSFFSFRYQTLGQLNRTRGKQLIKEDASSISILILTQSAPSMLKSSVPQTCPCLRAGISFAFCLQYYTFYKMRIISSRFPVFHEFDPHV